MVVGEFKRPGFSPYLELDLVKIGIEMRTMLNDLVRLGVSNPLVGGILIQGRHITTFQFDIIAPKVYRMVKLCDLAMFETLCQTAYLLVIVSRVMQVKQIGMDTAEKVKVLMNERSTRMKIIKPSLDQPWLSDDGHIPRKRSVPTTTDDEQSIISIINFTSPAHCRIVIVVGCPIVIHLLVIIFCLSFNKM